MHGCVYACIYSRYNFLSFQWILGLSSDPQVGKVLLDLLSSVSGPQEAFPKKDPLGSFAFRAFQTAHTPSAQLAGSEGICEFLKLMWWCDLCSHLCESMCTRVQVHLEARRGRWFPWSWSYSPSWKLSSDPLKRQHVLLLLSHLCSFRKIKIKKDV